MRQGFSLFEMLIVLSLMALLSSFVFPNLKKIQTKSHRIAAEINLRAFQSSLENYYIDNNTYPTGDLSVSDLFDVLKTAGIMKTSPINPYYNKPYTNTDSKGKITYSSLNGEEYALTLYETDGTTIQLTLNAL